MTYTHEFDPEAGLAMVRGQGIISLAVCLAAVDTLLEDGRLADGYGIVVDMREADYTPTLADARELGSLDGRAARLRRHPVAFVTTQPAAYSAATLLVTLAGLKGIRAKAFQELDPALAWLAGSRDR